MLLDFSMCTGLWDLSESHPDSDLAILMILCTIVQMRLIRYLSQMTFVWWSDAGRAVMAYWLFSCQEELQWTHSPSELDSMHV